MEINNFLNHIYIYGLLEAILWINPDNNFLK